MHGNQLFATTIDFNVFVTSDNGATWKKSENFVKAKAVGSDGKNIYALSQIGYKSVMLKSADVGATWENISSEVGLTADTTTWGFFSSNTKFVYAGIGYQVWRHVR